LLIITMQQRNLSREYLRKGFKPETSLIIDKECNILSNTGKVLQGGLNKMRSTTNCKMEQIVTVEKSGHFECKLQNHEMVYM